MLEVLFDLFLSERREADLRLKPHLHVVVLDGAYHEDGAELVWNELGHLQTRAVGQVLEDAVRRMMRTLRRHGLFELDPVSRITATPPNKKAYEAGSNPLWDHVITSYPTLRERADIWHQFAVFGGYVAIPGPFALTFLQQFLQDSLF